MARYSKVWYFKTLYNSGNNVKCTKYHGDSGNVMFALADGIMIGYGEGEMFGPRDAYGCKNTSTSSKTPPAFSMQGMDGE